MRVALLLSREFVRGHPADAARILERRPVAETSALLEELPAAAAAAALRTMVATSGADCLARIDARRAAAILVELPSDVASGLLLRLGRREREALLTETPAKTAAVLRERLRFRAGTAGALADTRVLSFAEEASLMAFPPDSAGSLMETRMATLPPDATAAEALDRVRRLSDRVTHNVYLVDQQGLLVGSVALQDLALAPPQRRLRELIRREPISVEAMAVLMRLGQDPAQASSIILTTVTDIIGFLSFLGIATLLATIL